VRFSTSFHPKWTAPPCYRILVGQRAAALPKYRVAVYEMDLPNPTLYWRAEIGAGCLIPA